jgi:hypothetical protein
MKNSFNLILGFNLIKNFWTWKTITSIAIHVTKDYAKEFFNKKNFMIKKLHDNNIFPHSKNTHNLKFMKFEFDQNSMYVFIISKVQKYFTTCKWCVIHMTYKRKL